MPNVDEIDEDEFEIESQSKKKKVKFIRFCLVWIEMIFRLQFNKIKVIKNHKERHTIKTTSVSLF